MQSMTAADVYGTARPRQPSNNAAPAPIEAGGNVAPKRARAGPVTRRSGSWGSSASPLP